MDMLAARMTNLMLTLGDVAAASGLELPAGDAVAEGAAEVASGNRGGFFGPVSNFLEGCLKVSASQIPALGSLKPLYRYVQILGAARILCV